MARWESRNYLFTSESVTDGHPDKVADAVADAVLDAALTSDPCSRVTCEALVTTGLVVLAGEITTRARLDHERIVRNTVTRIGYDDSRYGLDGHSCEVRVALDEQPPGCCHELRTDDELDAPGEHAMVFGYATDETPELMPMPIALAHQLARRLAAVRRDGTLPYLHPDGRTQVSVRYLDHVPVGVEQVLIATQHDDGVTIARIREDLWQHVVTAVLPVDLYNPRALRRCMVVNPTGRFGVAGPLGDAGLTGRRIVVDTYGGFSHHGGGAFSGKDPTHVDRSGAYAARHVAKNVVAAGLATRAEVQVSHAIGVAGPVSVLIDTFGTERVPRRLIEQVVDAQFDPRPAAVRSRLQLQRPIYTPTAAYGHFGRTDVELPWERTDRVPALRSAAGLDRAQKTHPSSA